MGVFGIDTTPHAVRELNTFLDDFEDRTARSKKTYINVPCVVDIETSSFLDGDGQKTAIQYAFVFGINGHCVIGRTMKELLNIFDMLIERYDISLEHRLIVYVHNLSYEFQFFRKWIEWEKVFSLEERKPVYALARSGIEFRCSYKLSNQSLANVGKNLQKYKVKKMVGDLDYNLIRSPETPLSDKEIGYILNDGLVVMAYIRELMENNKNDITKLPLTNTGFVREYCRSETLHNKDFSKAKTYYSILHTLTIDVKEYLELREAFQGGFTHANPLASGKIHENVTSYDFTSSYPSVILDERYPMSKGERYTPKNMEDFETCLNKYCCMFRIALENVESTIDFEHYISVSKCRNVRNVIEDNGRVVSADYLEMTITEQDFAIIGYCYKWNSIKIYDMIRYEKGYLPTLFIKSVLELYKKKTTLKGVVGSEADYQHSKGQLNATYGMMVTDICRDEITYTDDTDTWGTDTPDLEKVITKYNDDRKRFLFYPWGLWVTAYARRNLWTGIIACQYDYLYSDTDSVKVVDVEKHIEYFEDYNRKVLEKLETAMRFHKIPIEDVRPKTIKGVEKPIGVWDFDGHYKRFKTLGAKRYLTEDDDDEIHLTISGVAKKQGVAFLKWRYLSNTAIFRAFTNGLVFPPTYDGNTSATGKNLLTYIDDERTGSYHDYLGSKFEYYEKSGTHMTSNGYALSLSDSYLDYLTGIKERIE